MTSPPTDHWAIGVAGTLFFYRGSRLFVAFLFGIAAFLYRYKIPYDYRLLAGALALCLILSIFRPSHWMPFPVLNMLLVCPLIYITVFLGVSNISLPNLLRHGDYSYGIYLYGYPVQQAVFAFLPSVKILLVQAAISLIVVLVFAMVSWHAIEKPILRVRRKFSFVANQRLETETRVNRTKRFNVAIAQPE